MLSNTESAQIKSIIFIFSMVEHISIEFFYIEFKELTDATSDIYYSYTLREPLDFISSINLYLFLSES